VGGDCCYDGMLFLLLLLLLILLHPKPGDGVQEFLAQPSHTSVTKGDRVVLPCRVRAKSGALQWTRDGFGLGQDRSLPGYPRMRMVGQDITQDWDLEINPVELDDEADYQCQVLSKDPTQSIRSTTARLQVRAPCSIPSIAGGPLLQLDEGVTVQLQCSCRGARPPARLEWRLGEGGAQTGNTTVKQEVGMVTFTSLSLITVRPKMKQDGVEVRCRVAGRPNTETEARISVSFLPKLEVLGAGQDAGLRVGGRAVLECSGESRPGVEE